MPLASLVAPILTRTFRPESVSADAARGVLHVLAMSGYEPAIAALVRLMEDERVLGTGVLFGGLFAEGEFAVGDEALMQLIVWAHRSPVAKRAALGAINRVSEKRLQRIQEVLDLYLRKFGGTKLAQLPWLSSAPIFVAAIDERLKSQTPDKPRSKRGVRSG
jgi:hypothetical protein